MEWKSIAIPKAMYDNIKRIIPFSGHTSVSEYVRAKVNEQGTSLGFSGFGHIVGSEPIPSNLTLDLMRAEDFKKHLEEIKELEE